MDEDRESSHCRNCHYFVHDGGTHGVCGYVTTPDTERYRHGKSTCDNHSRKSDVPTGQIPSAENLEVFPDFAWKLISGSCMELVFRNDDDMLEALELMRAMRLPTVKAVAVDTNEESETASQAHTGTKD